ncbi:hypothetical protein [Evansella tamaricis]|uniref:Branched-chain amino acid ABC transporter substrate-binding protein n=1 Tax=Evansella tamaricis TaxID=2069301 RepID=A0ABS6JKQ4_9BACI|nr:hypothetical protein [Evansella tamaricis]MBU9714238.1 hypothetical protein [Evansella tamaricis]
MFKKIEDERLKLENLKNTRIIFIFQTILLFGLWIYDAGIQGKGVSGTPITIILLLTSVFSLLLNMRVSVENENKPKNENSFLHSYPKIVAMCVVISLVIASFILLITPDYPLRDSMIIGAVVFICFLSVFSFTYFVKKKQHQEEDME